MSAFTQLPHPGSDAFGHGREMFNARISSFFAWLAWHMAESWYIYLGLFALTSLLSLAHSIASPALDPTEPPLQKPSIPFIGHLIGLLRHQAAYPYMIWQRKHVPALTLPVLNGKIYMLYSPGLQQHAMRSRDMDAESFTVKMLPPIFGLAPETLPQMMGGDGIHEGIATKMFAEMRTWLSGDPLRRMQVPAFAYLGRRLRDVGPAGLPADSLYGWLRDAMGAAIAQSLFGPGQDPYAADPSLLRSQWDFDAGLQPLMLGVLPSVIARAGYRGRTRVWRTLLSWYKAERDSAGDVSAFVRGRAEGYRGAGIDIEEWSKLEVALMFVATANTIPVLYWLVAYIYLRPDLVEDLRREIAGIVTVSDAADDGETKVGGGGRIATLKVPQIAEKCPLLVSCFHETTRLGSVVITNRRVLKDTTISDSAAGVSFLLRKGADVMLPAQVVHRDAETWGADADEFNPRRFLHQTPPTGDKKASSEGGGGPAGKTAAELEQERRRRASYVPFGGGAHLCPGRAFAAAEVQGFVAALVAGFDVDGVQPGRVRMRSPLFGDAVGKPDVDGDGGPVTIRRREGWEDVDWRFEC